MAWSTPAVQVTGDTITAAIWNQNVVSNPIALTAAGVNFIVDGGGATITAGIKGDIEVPFKCDIATVTLLADASGSIVIDLWKDTYANFPPVDGDSICASALPTITTATKSQDSTLTGWTKACAAGDVIRVNVDSCTTISRCTMALRMNRS